MMAAEDTTEMSDDLRLDADGILPVKPMMGWSVSHVAGAAIVLTFHYADTPEALETKDTLQICLGIAPQEALRIADSLRTKSQALLDGVLPKGTNIH
jgi:hypothetical protein